MSSEIELPQIELPGIEHLQTLTGVKWNKFEPDVLPAWVADMDLRPPACVRDAVSAIVERSDFGYNRRASEQLPETFVRWQTEHHGWTPDVAGVRTFCDVLHAIDVALWLHTEPDDGIVLFTPIYPPFLKAIAGSGRRLIDVPLDPDGWRLDPDRLRDAIDDRTRVILTCNPHNPTGRVFDEAELAAIGDIAEERDLLVISDEVWADIVHPGSTHIPLAAVSDVAASRTMTISSASKAFNLAGLRCAMAHIGHQELADRFEELPTHLLGAVSTTGAEASLAAWTEGGAWLQSLREHLLARRDQLAARLAADLPQVGFVLPQATYLAWLDFRPLGFGENPSEELVAKAKVGLSPGPDFGPLGNGFARMNFATSPEILDELIDRIVMASTAR